VKTSPTFKEEGQEEFLRESQTKQPELKPCIERGKLPEEKN